MRVVIQRVRRASVEVDGQEIGRIDQGLLVLLAVVTGDGPGEVAWMARKLAGLRIFADEAGRMNRSLLDIGGGALVVSQFTLVGDCRRGRRPSFTRAAEPGLAEQRYEQLCDALVAEGVRRVERGRFAADMQVGLINDGPVTLVIDTPG